MADDAQTYNIAAIRKLLRAAFTPAELQRFCQDREAFRPVVDEFGPGHGLNEMVDDVITYCETRVLFDELLAEIKDYNPKQYARFKDHLYRPGPPPSTTSAPSPTTPAGPPHITERDAEIAPMRDHSWPQSAIVLSGILNRLRAPLRRRERGILTGLALILAVAVVAAAALLVLNYMRQRQTPQFWIERFHNTKSADVRVVSLARLLELTGREQDIQRLFFQELTPAEQVAMFSVSDPEGLVQDLVVVIKALYVKLDNTVEGSNDILQAMAKALPERSRLQPGVAMKLSLELEQWRRGRDLQREEEYQSAVDSYTLAIGQNEENPSTRIDLASAYVALGRYPDALAELVQAIELDPARRNTVKQIVNQNNDLFTYLGLHRSRYPEIAPFFPALTPTPTLTRTPTPTRTHTPTPTSTPTPTPTQISSVYVHPNNDLHVVIDAVCQPYRLYVRRPGQSFGDPPTFEYYRIWESLDCPNDLMIVDDVNPDTIYCIEIRSDDGQESYDLTSYRTGQQSKPFAGETYQDGVCPIK